MHERDTILAVLQGDLALAGLILVFVGFVLSKADSYSTRAGDKYRYFASAGAIPVLLSLIAAWICLDAVEGCRWAIDHSLDALKVVMVFVAIYVGVAVWTFLPK